MASVHIGRKGEIRIHELLKGSSFINEAKDVKELYDLVWNDIKIDVKTTLKTVNNSGKACTFVFRKRIKANDIVLVFYGLVDGKEYFWVDKCHQNVKTYKKLDSSLKSATELPEAIVQASKTKVKRITTEDARLVRISTKLKNNVKTRAKKEGRTLESMISILIEKGLGTNE